MIFAIARMLGILKRNQFNYDGEITNETVLAGTEKNFQGYNTLSTSDIVIQNGAASELKARKEVHVNTEFRAEYGSEVHIYNTETFPECPFFTGYLKEGYNSIPSSESSNNSKEIEIDFSIPENELTFSVQPNPSNGIFSLQINSNEKSSDSFNIKILDLLGNTLHNDLTKEHTFQIDLSTFSQGLYFIQVNSLTQKLIIQ